MSSLKDIPKFPAVNVMLPIKQTPLNITQSEFVNFMHVPLIFPPRLALFFSVYGLSSFHPTKLVHTTIFVFFHCDPANYEQLAFAF